MTDDSPALLTTEVETVMRRASGWERALWITGVVLLAISAALVYGTVKVIIAQDSSGQALGDIGGRIAFEQTSVVYGPALVTGGIVCIALALFLRALDTNARRRDALRPIQTAVAPVATEPSIPPIIAPTPETATATASATASTDYAAFMRPGAATDSQK